MHLAYLKDGSPQVRHSHILEVVLQSVHYGWNRHLERVLPIHYDSFVEVLRKLEKVALLEEYNRQTRHHLQRFREDDGRGRDEHTTAECPGIAHADDEDCVLYGEDEEAGVLHGVALCGRRKRTSRTERTGICPIRTATFLEYAVLLFASF